MTKKHSVAFMSCVGEVDYTRSMLLMQTVAAMGYDVIAMMPGSASGTALDDLIRHVPLPAPTRHFWYNRGWKNTLFALGQRLRIGWILFSKLVRLKPSICIGSEPDAWLLAILAKLFFGCRVVVDLREVYEDRAFAFPKLMQRSVRLLLRAFMYALSIFTDAIVHVSEERQQTYAYLAKPGIIIGNYPKLAAFPIMTTHVASTDNPPEQIIVIHVGALRPSYASNQLIEAMALAADRFPRLRFVVLGGVRGNLSYPDLLESLYARRLLQCFEQVPFDEVVRWLRVSHIGLSLVLPVDMAHSLAAPQKLYEYLAAGLPVVGADVSTIRGVLINHECGIVVEPTSSVAIADAIVRLAQNADLRLRMGQNARRAAETTFNWESQEARLEGLLTALEMR
ncbi:MAG: glycosyltransferase family 4 protein [Anaerolineae bacterium]|nr:glycosyltransferase family 4 protein [Anaerolineae bacterium]